MKKFVKITTRGGEAIIRTWIDVEDIDYLTQDSITQQGLNEGTLVLKNAEVIQLISFNETIDSLN
jgi:hypothetical protein